MLRKVHEFSCMLPDKKKYVNRPTELLDEILLLCNGKPYREISQVLEEVKNVVLDKSILTYSVNDYTPIKKNTAYIKDDGTMTYK